MKKVEKQKIKTEKEYRCKICGKILQKNGNICHVCFKDLKEYREKNIENELLKNVKQSQLDEVSNDEVIIEKKIDSETKLTYIQFKFKYNYLKDNIFKCFDYVMIMLIIFLGMLSILKNMYYSPLVIILYGFMIYLKHIYLKRKRETLRVYFYENKVVLKKVFPFLRIKTLKYEDLKDLKEYKKYRIYKRVNLIFQSLKTKGLNNYDIEIEDLKGLDDIAPLVIGLTGYIAPKESEITYKNILKDTYNNVKDAIINNGDNDSIKVKNKKNKTKTDKR